MINICRVLKCTRKIRVFRHERPCAVSCEISAKNTDAANISRVSRLVKKRTSVRKRDIGLGDMRIKPVRAIKKHALRPLKHRGPAIEKHLQIPAVNNADARRKFVTAFKAP